MQERSNSRIAIKLCTQVKFDEKLILTKLFLKTVGALFHFVCRQYNCSYVHCKSYVIVLACVLYLVILYLWCTFNDCVLVVILKTLHILQQGYHGESPGHYYRDCQRLNSYFIANEITTVANKHMALVSSCRTLTYIEKPMEVLYADLTKKVREHFSPKPSPLV